MKWQPVTRAEIESMIEDGLARADDSVTRAWAAIRVPITKWECGPMGDDGGGFWVVGERDGQVVWFNDIEEGFNTSPFTQRGTIGAYYCNQGDFDDYLMTLPEARTAEAFARRQPISILPSFATAPGVVGRRQTTYWEIHSETGEQARVHFSGKQEARFVAPRYRAAEIEDEHPLLIDYEGRWVSLFVSGKSEHPDAIVAAIERDVREATDGWRSASHYLGQGGPTNDILRSGHGLLLCGPEPIATAVATTLLAFSIKPSIVAGWDARKSVRVLLLGKSFVIADAFRCEPMEPKNAWRRSPRGDGRHDP